MTNDKKAVETVAELAAYRAMFKFTVNVLQALLVGHEKTDGPLILKQIEAMLLEWKGEFLHPAPLNLSPELQLAGNKVFQEVFSSLSNEVLDGLGFLKGSAAPM
jgi:hypothetical protein